MGNTAPLKHKNRIEWDLYSCAIKFCVLESVKKIRIPFPSHVVKPEIHGNCTVSYDVVQCRTFLHYLESLEYVVFRRDHVLQRGGGVLVAVKSTLCPTRMDNAEQDDVEAVVVKIKTRRSKWTLCIVYRPPNIPVSYWDAFQSLVDNVLMSNSL